MARSNVKGSWIEFATAFINTFQKIDGQPNRCDFHKEISQFPAYENQ